MPFLTLLDPRAKIKGSRDPLGFQAIWTRFGRQVVTNLTTVTTSVRGFTTLLMGLYFADQAVSQANAAEADFSNLFLKFEQLAAYSRVGRASTAGQSDEGILGILRVKKNLSEAKGRVRISSHQTYQILSNQKTYGLWGLYIVAAKNSGLIDAGNTRLSPAATQFVESEYLPRLDRRGQFVYSFFEQDQSFEPGRKDAKLATSLAGVLGSRLSPTEKAFYTHHLVCGGEAGSLQQRLWQQIKAANCPGDFSMAELSVVMGQAASQGEEALTTRLENIKQVETVLAPLAVLFGYVLCQENQAVTRVVQDLEKHWGPLTHVDSDAFAKALSTLEDIEPESCLRLINLAENLYTGDYAPVLQLLLAQNTAVMAARGSAPWIKLKQNRFDVRVQEESGPLLDKNDLPRLWLNSYFINSLKTVGLQVNSPIHDE